MRGRHGTQPGRRTSDALSLRWRDGVCSIVPLGTQSPPHQSPAVTASPQGEADGRGWLSTALPRSVQEKENRRGRPNLSPGRTKRKLPGRVQHHYTTEGCFGVFLHGKHTQRKQEIHKSINPLVFIREVPRRLPAAAASTKGGRPSGLVGLSGPSAHCWPD